jgi:raffinose/stachyose/melibiose transport system permease protein
MRSRYMPYAFLAPSILLLLFIFAGPFLAVTLLSFTDWDGLSWSMKFIGLKNYAAIFTEREAVDSLSNTILFLVLTVVLQNLFALLAAVVLTGKVFGKTFFRAVYFMPSIISIIAIGAVWSMIFDPISGPYVYVLEHLGLQSLADMRWLADPKLVMFAIVFVNVWQWAGWNMVVYLAGLQGIPSELYEAASIDGAGAFGRFRFITFPLLAPAITINIVMTTIGGIKVFELPFVMTGGGPGHASETIAITIIRNSFALNKVGYGSAMSLILVVFILAVTFIQNKVLSKAEEATEF